MKFPMAFTSLFYGIFLVSMALLVFPGGHASLRAQTGEDCPASSLNWNEGSSHSCHCSADQAQRGTVWGTKIFTSDSAICRAAIHAGAIGTQGGTVTVQRLPGQDKYVGSNRNGVESRDYGSYSGSISFVSNRAFGRQTTPQPQQQSASCPSNSLNWAEGSSHSCHCSAQQARQGTVWGSKIFTSDSAICRAAMHAGAIGVQGGTVAVRRLPGQDKYIGSNRNGVESRNYGSYSGSMAFLKSTAFVEDCSGNALNWNVGDLHTCRCAASETQRGVAYGTGVYTHDSHVCRAALHAGVIRAEGGNVTFRRIPGRRRYTGSLSNGVKSLDYGPYSGSYVFE